MQISMTRRGPLRWVAMFALLANLGAAHAQRQGMPVVDFIDVPVSAPAMVTLAQVRSAIRAAAFASQWDFEDEGPGAARLTLISENWYVIVARVTFSKTSYSLLYVDSKEMNFQMPSQSALGSGNSREAERQAAMRDIGAGQAAIAVAERYSRFPETAFTRLREDALIHPSYHGLTHELVRGINRHLKAIE